jgi:hypothetical protein
MRITNIRLAQKTNLGNYESLDFAAEAVIDEDETVNDAILRLSGFVDWHAKKPIRDAKARTYRSYLEAGTDEQKAEAEAWLKIYDERKAAAEAI